MLKQVAHRNSTFRFKKTSVGRMLIAAYILIVLALSATAKAEVNVPCLKIRNQISN